jgi:hypothetical protein
MNLDEVNSSSVDCIGIHVIHCIPPSDIGSKYAVHCSLEPIRRFFNQLCFLKPCQLTESAPNLLLWLDTKPRYQIDRVMGSGKRLFGLGVIFDSLID